MDRALLLGGHSCPGKLPSSPPNATVFDVETGASTATNTELPPEGSKVTGCLRHWATG